MVRRGRQIGIEVGVAGFRIGNRERRELARAEDPIILGLRNAGVVKNVIGEGRRRMTYDAVAAACRDRLGWLVQKNLKSLQLGDAKLKFLPLMQPQRAVLRLRDKLWIRQRID